MWVVLKLLEIRVALPPSSFLERDCGLDKGKILCFLPVYESREDALADHPGAKLQKMKGKLVE